MTALCIPYYEYSYIYSMLIHSIAFMMIIYNLKRMRTPRQSHLSAVSRSRKRLSTNCVDVSLCCKVKSRQFVRS